MIHAQAWASGSASRYGKLANLDRAFPTHGRTLGGVPVGSGQGFHLEPDEVEVHGDPVA